jgi:CRP-like cAMP-binding protein
MHEAIRRYILSYTNEAISDEEYQIIQDAFVPKKIRKRQYLLQEGDVCKHLAFIVHGAMRQYSVDDKGIEHIIHFGIENWWIGDRESFIMLTPSKYNVDAVEDSDVLLLTHEKMQLLSDKIPAFTRTFSVLDQRNFIASQKRIHASISLTAEERYADLAERNPSFLQRFPQNMVASYLGISPETLSRIRKKALSR